MLCALLRCRLERNRRRPAQLPLPMDRGMVCGKCRRDTFQSCQMAPSAEGYRSKPAASRHAQRFFRHLRRQSGLSAPGRDMALGLYSPAAVSEFHRRVRINDIRPSQRHGMRAADHPCHNDHRRPSHGPLRSTDRPRPQVDARPYLCMVHRLLRHRHHGHSRPAFISQTAVRGQSAQCHIRGMARLHIHRTHAPQRTVAAPHRRYMGRIFHRHGILFPRVRRDL